MEQGKIESAKRTTNTASPFTQLNDLLALGTLQVSLHIPDDVEIVARKDSGPTYGMERMSDGERNAVIMAATVLTVESGTTLLIDEPERHLHRAIIAPFLSALFEQRPDCSFVVSTHELFLPVENANAQVLMTRSCTWAGDSPKLGISNCLQDPPSCQKSCDSRSWGLGVACCSSKVRRQALISRFVAPSSLSYQSCPAGAAPRSSAPCMVYALRRATTML